MKKDCCEVNSSGNSRWAEEFWAQNTTHKRKSRYERVNHLCTPFAGLWDSYF
jgi:hypothetical protein